MMEVVLGISAPQRKSEAHNKAKSGVVVVAVIVVLVVVAVAVAPKVRLSRLLACSGYCCENRH